MMQVALMELRGGKGRLPLFAAKGCTPRRHGPDGSACCRHQPAVPPRFLMLFLR